MKCRCTYGVTLPMEYLQVAGWWQRWCLRIRHCASWGSLRPGSPTSTRVTHRLQITRRLRRSITRRARCSSFSIPTKETIPVYSHLCTHATSTVSSSKIKNISCDLRVFGAFLRCTAMDCSVRDLPLRRVHVLSLRENHWKPNTRNCDKILSITTVTIEKSTGVDKVIYQ